MMKNSISFKKENQHELKALTKSFFRRLQGAPDKSSIKGIYAIWYEVLQYWTRVCHLRTQMKFVSNLIHFKNKFLG